MPGGYTNVAGFRSATIMPGTDVDSLESAFPGFLQSRIDWWSSYINARLAKRYAVPFDPASPPFIVLLWVVALVTRDAFAKRGFNPTSAMDEASILDPAKQVLDDLKEAADSNTGLFDLPLRESAPGASGVVFGGPLGSSEASPYAWIDAEAEALRG